MSTSVSEQMLFRLMLKIYIYQYLYVVSCDHIQVSLYLRSALFIADYNSTPWQPICCLLLLSGFAYKQKSL